MKKVSLITGCFNGEKFIDRCFESILTQTFNDIEVIFVDDGSTDNSLELAKSYKPAFKERGYDFHIISQNNMGFYPQSGIKIATGKYISTLDIDDLLFPDSIKKRAEFLENNPEYAAVRTNGYTVHENNPDKLPTLFAEKESAADGNVFEKLLFGETYNWAGTYMVKSEILFEYYPDKVVPMTRYTQNLEILLPVTYNRKVGFIHEPLMNYMRHDISCTTGKNSYETALALQMEFKNVRIRILKWMNLLTPEIQSKLDQIYDSIFLNITFSYGKVNEFNKIYNRIERPDFVERFKYSEINNKRLMRLLLRLQNRLFKILKLK